jgi:hypothetical protein
MSAPYAWQVTYDHLDHVRDDTHGPRDVDDDLLIRLRAFIALGQKNAPPPVNDGDPEWFKIYDDDGELYYTGARIGLQGPTEYGFEPLDDYGTPNAGATEIHYLDPTTGKWDQL